MGIETANASGERFRRSHQAAQMQDLLGLIRGKTTNLVSYEEVARRVKAYQQIEMGTQMIPLSQIVGSVGRYRDFTREFLPRTNISKERWLRVDQVLNSQTGYPPIEVYKIGEVYFVRDGNHRISVARANGLTHIEAYVTEVKTDIPLTLDDFERDEWLLKIERAEYLEKTQLDVLRPDNNVVITEPGRYRILLRHIFVHQYLRNLDLEREGSDWRISTWAEAVTSWYDNVYTPVVEALRDYKLLEQFPDRTEADMYLWITHHREELANLYDLAPLSPQEAVSTFAQIYDDRLLQRAYKSVKYTLMRARGWLDKPMGMSDEQFATARARYKAGERTLMEAEELRAPAGADTQEENAEEQDADSDALAQANAALDLQERSGLYLTAQ